MPDSIGLYRAYAARGLGLWFLVRGVASAFILLSAGNPLRLTAAAAIAMVGISVGICYVDTHRKKEWPLLANLAVHPATLAATFVVPAILGETAVRVAAHLL